MPTPLQDVVELIEYADYCTAEQPTQQLPADSQRLPQRETP